MIFGVYSRSNHKIKLHRLIWLFNYPNLDNEYQCKLATAHTHITCYSNMQIHSHMPINILYLAKRQNVKDANVNIQIKYVQRHQYDSFAKQKKKCSWCELFGCGLKVKLFKLTITKRHNFKWCSYEWKESDASISGIVLS